MTPTEIKNYLKESNNEALTIDGADEALIGVSYLPNKLNLACYDYNKLVEVFDAEWVDFNILGAYMGENTPIVIFT